jgi:hypothetical protein
LVRSEGCLLLLPREGTIEASFIVEVLGREATEATEQLRSGEVLSKFLKEVVLVVSMDLPLNRET